MHEDLIAQARDHIARTWTAQGWRAEQSLDHPGYWDVWTMDATGQRRIILARYLSQNTAALMCFVSTALPKLADALAQSEAGRVKAEHFLQLRDRQIRSLGDLWARDAEKALAGDLRALRNRLELHRIGPVKVVQSDAALTDPGEKTEPRP